MIRWLPVCQQDENTTTEQALSVRQRVAEALFSVVTDTRRRFVSVDQGTPESAVLLRRWSFALDDLLVLCTGTTGVLCASEGEEAWRRAGGLLHETGDLGRGMAGDEDARLLLLLGGHGKVRQALGCLHDATAALCPASRSASLSTSTNPLWQQQERAGMLKRTRGFMQALATRMAAAPFGPKGVDRSNIAKTSRLPLNLPACMHLASELEELLDPANQSNSKSSVFLFDAGGWFESRSG